jgi:hypothetical protein
VVVVDVEVVVEVVEVVVGVDVDEVVASVDVEPVVTVEGDDVDVAGAMSVVLDCTLALHAVAKTSAIAAAARPSIMLPDGSGNPPRPDLTPPSWPVCRVVARTATVSLMRVWRSVRRGLG